MGKRRSDSKTKNEKLWLSWVKNQRCMINNHQCGGCVEAHHITDGGRRIGDFYALPLCRNHHGPQTPVPMGEAVHKGKKMFEEKYGSQFELLEKIRMRWVAQFQSKPWEIL